MTTKGLSGKLKQNIELEVEGDGILFKNISISLTYLYSNCIFFFFFFWVISFGPQGELEGMREIQTSDLLLINGSQLTVLPLVFITGWMFTHLNGAYIC